MITLPKVEIFIKFIGDGVGFVHCATTEEKSIMDYPTWALIDSLVQDLLLIKNKRASPEFISQTDKKLQENCDTFETIQALKSIDFGSIN